MTADSSSSGSDAAGPRSEPRPESGLDDPRFQRIIEIAADAIISMDEAGRIMMFNRGAEEIFGYDREEVLGEPLALLLPERFRQHHQAHVRRFAESDVPARRMGERREIAGLRKGGREFPAEASISTVETPGGRIFTVVLRDITHRKRVEETQRFLADASAVLAQSLDYQTTLEGLARLALPGLGDWCMVDVLREDGSLERVQAAHADPSLEPVVQELLAYPPPAGRAHPVRAVLETGRPELIERVSDRFMEGIATDPDHLRVLRRLGVRSLLVVPLIARTQTLGALVLVSADPERLFTTEDRVLAEELGRRAALAVDNARLYRQAQEAVATRDEVLSVVSHDLGQPLSAVRVSTRVLSRLREPDLTQAEQDQIESIRTAVSQMDRLIQDLLEVRRIEAGRLRLDPRPAPVVGLVREAVRAHRSVAEERGVGLEAHLDDPIPETAVVDRDRVQQIFANLIGNAIKFTPEGGRVTVGAGPARLGRSAEEDQAGRDAAPGSEAVALWVRDTGPGLDASELEHVFDRFWQARHQGSHGVGLGLAIAKGMTEAHGGRIRVESHPDSGSCFTFVLPLEGPAASGGR